MTQVPPPGTKVRRGWSIRVAQSLGPQRVAIPDVTGGSERVAELNIRRRGLESGFGRARQFARRAAGPGDIAKPARERQRSVRAKNQFAGQRRPRAADLCDAEPHWTTARQRDAGACRTPASRSAKSPCFHQLATSQPGEPQAAPVAPSAVSEPSAASMIVSPDSSARTENCGRQRSEFRSPLAFTRVGRAPSPVQAGAARPLRGYGSSPFNHRGEKSIARMHAGNCSQIRALEQATRHPSSDISPDCRSCSSSPLQSTTLNSAAPPRAASTTASFSSRSSEHVE